VANSDRTAPQGRQRIASSGGIAAQGRLSVANSGRLASKAGRVGERGGPGLARDASTSGSRFLAYSGSRLSFRFGNAGVFPADLLSRPVGRSPRVRLGLPPARRAPAAGLISDLFDGPQGGVPGPPGRPSCPQTTRVCEPRPIAGRRGPYASFVWISLSSIRVLLRVLVRAPGSVLSRESRAVRYHRRGRGPSCFGLAAVRGRSARVLPRGGATGSASESVCARTCL